MARLAVRPAQTPRAMLSLVDADLPIAYPCGQGWQRAPQPEEYGQCQ
jgi:hypothetical protein